MVARARLIVTLYVHWLLIKQFIIQIMHNIQGAAERTPRFGRVIASGGERVQWWGARHRIAVYVPFSVCTMVWLEEHWAFIVEEFIKNGGSPIATQHAFRIRFALGRREAVSDKKTIYLWVSNFRQTGQTLEALKEAIRQELAAITPEMVLKFMDNYREATSVYQYSRPPLEWWFVQNTLI